MAAPEGPEIRAGGPGFRAPEGPEIPAPEGPEIRPEGPEIRAPGGAGPRGPPLFFPFPIFPRLFYLFFTLFYFSRFRAHVEVGSSSREPAFDLFARVGRRGLRDRLFFWPGKGSPLYVAKKS